MAVYVDAIEIYSENMISKRARKYGDMWRHMYADTLEELHDMALKIGLSRKHFQNRKNFPHYDLVLPKRDKAFCHGAVDDSRHTVMRAMILAQGVKNNVES